MCNVPAGLGTVESRFLTSELRERERRESQCGGYITSERR